MGQRLLRTGRLLPPSSPHQEQEAALCRIGSKPDQAAHFPAARRLLHDHRGLLYRHREWGEPSRKSLAGQRHLPAVQPGQQYRR